jgi:hypothetical protein
MWTQQAQAVGGEVLSAKSPLVKSNRCLAAAANAAQGIEDKFKLQTSLHLP